MHTLRKQFTFNCFRNGVPLEVCSKLLGHSSVKTTEKYYTSWDTQMLRDGLKVSRNALKTGKKPKTKKP
ncbi:MAG: tyrosine-type recombinase/integrase [Acidobacteriota bacterium]